VATRRQHPAVVVLAQADVDKAVVELAQVVDAGAAGGREIAIFGGINPLTVFDAADQFRESGN
jgi:hypothetical protein